MVAFTRGQTDAALEAFELAGGHARRAGIPDDLVGWRALSRLYGRTPLPELLAWLDANEPRDVRDYWLRGCRGVAVAMAGRLEEGRSILAETREELAERGVDLQLAVLSGIESVIVELIADRPETAAELGEWSCVRLEELDALAFLSTAAAYLAEALVALDRLDEADSWATRAAEVGAEDDVWTQITARRARAKVLGRRGEQATAEALAREALSIVEATDDVNTLGDVHSDLSELLVLAGRPDEAVAALETALDCYARKGNLVSAARTRARLDELGAGTS
jgi:tetratricopeptide (TPR) repeat protein